MLTTVSIKASVLHFRGVSHLSSGINHTTVVCSFSPRSLSKEMHKYQSLYFPMVSEKERKSPVFALGSAHDHNSHTQTSQREGQRQADREAGETQSESANTSLEPTGFAVEPLNCLQNAFYTIYGEISPKKLPNSL